MPLDGQMIAAPQGIAGAGVERDLRTYFGDSVERYLPFWRKHMARDGQNGRFRLDRPSWLWGAFLFGALWGLHRRLYAAVAVWAVAIIALGLFFGGATGATLGQLLSVLVAAYARPFTVYSALKRIRRIDAKGLTPEARIKAIRRAGETSIVAPLLLVAVMGGYVFLLAGGATTAKSMIALPDCDSPAVQAVVTDLAAGALGKREGLATLAAGSATELRAETAEAGNVIVRDCGAAIVVDGRALSWNYRVTWQEPAGGRFRVDLAR